MANTIKQVCFLLAVDGGGEDHTGCRHAVGQQPLDEGFELVHGLKRDFDEECFSAGDVVALLYGVDGREEFEKWPVVSVVAGEPNERHDGVAERFFVELRAIADDHLFAFEAMDSLCYGGR